MGRTVRDRLASGVSGPSCDGRVKKGVHLQARRGAVFEFAGACRPGQWGCGAGTAWRAPSSVPVTTSEGNGDLRPSAPRRQGLSPPTTPVLAERPVRPLRGEWGTAGPRRRRPAVRCRCAHILRAPVSRSWHEQGWSTTGATQAGSAAALSRWRQLLAPSKHFGPRCASDRLVGIKARRVGWAAAGQHGCT